MRMSCLMLFIICAMTSCNIKNIDNETNVDTRRSLRDTVYIKPDSAIILESMYLTLDSIKNGETFKAITKNMVITGCFSHRVKKHKVYMLKKSISWEMALLNYNKEKS